MTKREAEGASVAIIAHFVDLPRVAQNGATLRAPRAQNLRVTRRTSSSSKPQTNQPLVATRVNRRPSSTRSDLTSVDIQGNLEPFDILEDQRDMGRRARTSIHSTSRRLSRQATVKPTDDIPVFDRNKVSLDFPGSLFGPSVSLLIRTTKIIGDVIQNSAVRYQSFLRLFRPLFRGQFEIKGLDPPTTTTTTTTTTPRTTTTARTSPPATADNEINRRR